MKPNHKFSLSSSMEMQEEERDEEKDAYALIPKPMRASWFLVLISLQADAIYDTLVVLTSPITLFLSVSARSYRRATVTTATVEKAAQRIPSNIRALLRKLYVGILGVVHVSMLLLVVMLLAVLFGVGLVRMYLEEPVVVRDRIFFDYTDANPNAFFHFAENHMKKRKQVGVPVGHTIHVSLVLLLPESDFNRHIGLFQLSAELLSSKGEIIAKSSQPWMLRFRSFPIRLMRTFLLGLPLLIGISSETQIMTIDILKHKEGHPRTSTIKVTLSPRSGTFNLPQLYEAEIAVTSQPPWNKVLLYNWKWTLYVWTSLYLYVVFLVAILCCCRPLMFPRFPARSLDNDAEKDMRREELAEEASKARKDGKDVAEMMRRWREQRRSKRRAVYSQRAISEAECSSAASSMSLTRDDVEEEAGDSDFF